MHIICLIAFNIFSKDIILMKRTT